MKRNHKNALCYSWYIIASGIILFGCTKCPNPVSFEGGHWWGFWIIISGFLSTCIVDSMLKYTDTNETGEQSNATN